MSSTTLFTKRLGLLLTVAALAAACSTSSAAGPSATASAAATAASGASPSTVATPSDAASSSPSDSAASSASAAPSAATAAQRYTTPLKGICPDTVVVQTNWFPEADHGYVYQLIGPGGIVDTKKLTYTGPLGSTGVNLEIRAGGPAIGYQLVSSILYQDPSILLGFVGTDEAIQNSGSNPTTAVFANYDKNPQIFLWGDPSWNFTSVADIGKANAPVLAFDGSTYLDVFVAQGLLSKAQIDTSYKGDPSRFVAAGGKVVQQGFATNEPWIYEHEVPAWNKPVKFLLVNNEYPVYQSALSIRSDKLAANAACLQKLIPLFQAANRDYVADPTAVNGVIRDYVAQLKAGFTLSDASLAAAVQQIRDLKLVENGTDGTLGSFDTARLQKLIDAIGPVIAKTGKTIKAGLAPADLATTQFLDPGIHQ
jgi:hypothetical protein